MLSDLLEEVSSLHVDTHGSEDDGKLVALGLLPVHVLEGLARQSPVHQAGLATDLSGNVVVGQTCIDNARVSRA